MVDVEAKALICGVASTALNADERAFLGGERPWGLILFARNCGTAGEIADLVAEYRDIVGRADAPVFIDQEGGRVQRIKPPLCPAYPPGRTYGVLYDNDHDDGLRAAYIGARLIAADLKALGINADCLPVLDVPVAGAHDVIGDRAYAADPAIVATLGRMAATGLIAGGVLPVIKHIPGHGRATADSHLALPRVDTGHAELSARDFLPFKALHDMPLAMTAHVVYAALDDSAPATTSRRVIHDIIRGELGFNGCLMSDDVSMKALSGSFAERTAALFEAGCDLALHCNGEMAEMRAVAAATPALAGQAARRARSALRSIGVVEPLDRDAASAEFAALLDKARALGAEGVA